MTGISQVRISAAHLSMPCNQLPGSTSVGIGMPSSSDKSREEIPKINMKGDSLVETATRLSQRSQLPVGNIKSKGQIDDKNKASQNMQHDSVQNGKLSSVFKGKIFCFSNSFPEDRVSFLGSYFVGTVLTIQVNNVNADCNFRKICGKYFENVNPALPQCNLVNK